MKTIVNNGDSDELFRYGNEEVHRMIYSSLDEGDRDFVSYYILRKKMTGEELENEVVRLEEYLSSNPGCYNVAAKLGSIRCALWDRYEVLDFRYNFREAIRLKPNDEYLLYLLCFWSIQTGNKEEYRVHLVNLGERYITSPFYVMVQLEAIYEFDKNYEEAIWFAKEYWEVLSKNYQTRRLAKIDIILSHKKLKDSQMYEKHLREFIDMFEECEWGLEDLGTYLLGGYDEVQKDELLLEAEKCFRRIGQLNPKYERYNYYLGQVAQRRGNLREKLRFYNLELEISPNSRRCLTRRVKCLMENKDYDLALEQIEKLIPMYPDRIQYQIRKCDLLVRLGKHSEGLSEFNKLLSIFESEEASGKYSRFSESISESLRRIGSSFMKLFDKGNGSVYLDEAEKCFRKGGEIFPNGNHNYYFARVCSRKNKPSEEIEYYCKDLEIHPKNRLTLKYRAYGYADLGEFDNALKDLELLCRLYPKVVKHRIRRLQVKISSFKTLQGIPRSEAEKIEEELTDISRILRDERYHRDMCDTYCQLAGWHGFFRDYEKVIIIAASALRFDPKSTYAYGMRILANYNLGGFEEVIIDHTNLLSVAEDDFDCCDSQLHWCAGVAYRIKFYRLRRETGGKLNSGRTESEEEVMNSLLYSSIRCFRGCIRSTHDEPTNSDVFSGYNKIGKCYLTLKKFGKAYRSFRKAIDFYEELDQRKKGDEKIEKFLMREKEKYWSAERKIQKLCSMCDLSDLLRDQGKKQSVGDEKERMGYILDLEDVDEERENYVYDRSQEIRQVQICLLDGNTLQVPCFMKNFGILGMKLRHDE